MAIALALAAGACGSPEATVVDKYFNAVRTGDNQTLSSFATVGFNKQVQDWRITKTHVEEKGEIDLPNLVRRAKDLQKALDENKKAAHAYSVEHYAELNQVDELRKASHALPAKLSSVATEWDTFNAKDRDLKKQLADAKVALEREQRNVRLSVGDQSDVENLQGEVATRRVELDVTVDGQPQPYVMTLRKYNVRREGGPSPPSRWMVVAVQPATRTATPASPPSSPFAAVDRILQALPVGSIAFHVPGVMRLDEVYVVDLVLSPTLTVAELQEHLDKSVGEELPVRRGDRGGIETAELRISDEMQAHLTGQAFNITAVKPESQRVSGREPTEWQWEVTPTKEGSQKLRLVLNAVLRMRDKDAPRPVRTFERTVDVQVTIPERVKGFVGDNWQWLWTLLLPVAAWAWNVWRKRRNPPGSNTYSPE